MNEKDISSKEEDLSANASSAIRDEPLNQDNRINYKKRREELNRRVRSLLEQKKQIARTRN